MNFFLERQLIKLSCTYQPLSFCKNFKKFLQPFQSYEHMLFSGPKQPIYPEQNFFGTKHYYYFHLHISKFKKNSYSVCRVMKMRHFWAKNVPLAQNKNIFEKNYSYHFHLAVSPFHWAKLLKSSYCRSTVMRMLHFLAQNCPFSQMKFFFRKLVNKPCSFHSCLFTCQKARY